MTVEYKSFSLGRKLLGVEKALSRYSIDKQEEIRILKTLLLMREYQEE